MDMIDTEPQVFRGLPSENTEPASQLPAIFSARRDLAVAQGLNRPMVRLASFLLFLSRDNARSGLDGTTIADDLRCGVIAELLKL